MRVEIVKTLRGLGDNLPQKRATHRLAAIGCGNVEVAHPACAISLHKRVDIQSANADQFAVNPRAQQHFAWFIKAVVLIEPVLLKPAQHIKSFRHARLF